jgi:signal peptidase I
MAERGPDGPDGAPPDGPDGAPAEVDGPGPLRRTIEWALVIAGALVIALLVKAFLFQAYFIPSSSMEPALEPGDRVVVNKLSYDLHDVDRGDLVVFERVGDDQVVEDLIKRVVGLPNETVEVRDSVVFIDGQPLDEPYLPAGIEFGDSPPVVVPDASVFVMGDNRSDSLDSRVFGPIRTDQIVGRAAVRIWPPSGIGLL